MPLHSYLPAAPSRPALHPIPSPRSQAPALAAVLDRLADAELQHGHHAQAEYLARQAAAIRGATR